MAETPASELIRAVVSSLPRGYTAQLEAVEPREVFIEYIEGSGIGLVNLICQKADELGVKLTLCVDVYAQDDGGKLVPYYESKGFVITNVTDAALDAQGNFDLSRLPMSDSEEYFHDTVGMEREPQQRSLNESYGFGYSVDNPATRGQTGGVEWLNKKQRWAEEAAEGRYKGLTGYMFTGSVTAWMGQTQTMFFPSRVLASIPGAMDENRRPGEPQFDRLLEVVKEQGYRMDRNNAVLVGVNHKGQAYVFEGNTRAAVAKALGIPYIPAEFRWFNGGEEAPGLWTPEQVAALAKDHP